MKKWLSTSFWILISRFLLRNRLLVILMIAAFTVFMECNGNIFALHKLKLIYYPDDHKDNIAYTNF